MNMTFLLQIMQTMEITAGPSAHQYATRANEWSNSTNEAHCARDNKESENAS